eukprot:287898_1
MVIILRFVVLLLCCNWRSTHYRGCDVNLGSNGDRRGFTAFDLGVGSDITSVSLSANSSLTSPTTVYSHEDGVDEWLRLGIKDRLERLERLDSCDRRVRI